MAPLFRPAGHHTCSATDPAMRGSRSSSHSGAPSVRRGLPRKAWPIPWRSGDPTWSRGFSQELRASLIRLGETVESGVLSHPITTVRLVQVPITRSARRQAHEASGVRRKLVTTHETRPRRAAFRLQYVDPWRPLPKANSDSYPAGRARAKGHLAATDSAPPVGARWRRSSLEGIATRRAGAGCW